MNRLIRPNGARGGANGPASPGIGTQVRCPRCQNAYAAQIVNVVDTRLAPQLKAALLGGYLNRTRCPACGAVGVMNVPLVYHDPDKELLLVLIPTELNLSADQQQRLIGSFVQAVMSNLPADQRKGYFLQPKTVLTMRRLIEQILEADGVTPDMIETQERRFRLLSEMLRAKGDPELLKGLIQEHRDQIDYNFFASLIAAVQESALAGDTSGAEQLLDLRDRLLEEPELVARLPQQLPPGTTLEMALEKLLAVADDEQALAAMVGLNRPIFDYLFFQGLTAHIERARGSGDTAQAGRLATLRSRLLDEIERQDEALRTAQQRHLQLIEEILKSPDRQQAVRQHLAEIDALFFNTLSAAIEAARAEGNIERSAHLDELRQTVVGLLAEVMPAGLGLVNRLLSLDSPEQRRAVLAESTDLVNDDLLELVEGLLEGLEQQGRDVTVSRLRAIQAEIKAAQEASRAPERRV